MNEFKPLDDLGKTLPSVTVPSKVDSPFELPRQPPIGIVHILVWTACTAVLMAVYRWFNFAGEMPGVHAIFYTVTQVPYSIIYGASLGGLILFVYRRLFGGAPFPIQPGHWLLLFAGIICLGSMSMAALFKVASEWTDIIGRGNTLMGVRMLVIQCTQAAFLAWTVWQFRGELYWRLHFWARLAVCIVGAMIWLPFLAYQDLYGVFALTRGLDSCSIFVWGVWLVAAAVADLAKAKRRDWLHWLGVAVSLGAVTMYLISRLWFWFAISGQ